MSSNARKRTFGRVRPAKIHITKICLYNFDPLKPHFYIVKMGFTGVYIIFLISAQNIDCGWKYEKYQSFLPENFQFLEVKFSIYLSRLVFVMRSVLACAKSQILHRTHFG